MNSMQRAGRFMASAVLLAAAVWCGGAVAPARDAVKKNTKFPQQILIIRHGEKTNEDGDFHLSKAGQERAEALPQLFEASKNRPEPFPTPDFIFAASNSKSSHRPLETVTPLAMKLKLTINDKFESKVSGAPADGEQPKKGMLGLRDALFNEPKYFGKTILISWRHGMIPELAKTLKASKAPAKWPDDAVFDRVWQITYDEEGNATFVDRPQRLMPGDAK